MTADTPAQANLTNEYIVPNCDPARWFSVPAAPGGATLRRATAADVPAVRELTRAAYAKWIALIGREPRPMTADYDVAVQHHRIELLVLNGELVALIEMAARLNHLLIVNVAVAPSHRGRGHGYALLRFAEDLARSLGLREIRLYTNGLFAENLRLYGRLGYQTDREETHPQLGVAVYMSKRLPTPAEDVVGLG
jgi:GNAT superfamily N-acetyltransferase